MKNKLFSMFLVFLCTFFAVTGCNDNKIEEILLVDESINKEYMVLQDVNIDEILIETIYDNGSSSLDTINESMYSISSIDNTKVGEQEIYLYVNYKGTEKLFSVKINFVLPSAVAAVVESINELPQISEINFDDEDLLNEVYNQYLLIDSKYKVFVSNYNDLMSKIDYLNGEKQNALNPDVVSQKNIYINYLNELVDALDSSKYSSFAWNKIITIRDRGIDELNNYKNYNIIKDIVTETQEKIESVETIEQTIINDYKINIVENLIAYRNLFINSDYSSNGVKELDNILNVGITKINSYFTIDEINVVYDEYRKLLDDVLTKDEEAELAINNMIANKIYEATQHFLTYNLNKYDSEGKTSLINYLNRCQILIKKTTDVAVMDKYISNLKKELASVETIEVKQIKLLNDYKENTLKEVNEIYKSMKVYNYDSSDRQVIEEIFNVLKNEIKVSLSEQDIDLLVLEAKTRLEGFLTLEEKAILKLEETIEKYSAQINEVLSTYEKANYSEENWNKILEIIYEAKMYVNTLDISVLEKTIIEKLNTKYQKISEVPTISEEYDLLLVQTKNNALITLNSFYNELKKDNYTASELEFITNKLSNVTNTINDLDNVNSINKLVADTIRSIENI